MPAHRRHPRRHLVVLFVSVALVAVGCGDATDVAAPTSSTAATAAPATTTATPATTTPTGSSVTTTRPPTPTTAKKKPVPGVPPGPTDPDTIVGDAWYRDLQRPTQAKCASMRETAVGSTAGAALTDLYLAAAAACLGRWDEAKSAFSRWKASGSDDPGPQACGRPFVVTFVEALLARRAADPAFKPEFVAAAAAKPCPTDPVEP